VPFRYEGERAEGKKEGMRSMAAKLKGERKWGRVWRMAQKERARGVPAGEAPWATGTRRG
jgi:hypothetical protein